MARSLQEQLDDLDAAIAVRESGDAFDGYSDDITLWRGAPLKDLYAERARLLRAINSSSSSGVHVIRPYARS